MKITDYTFGKIDIDGTVYTTDVIIYPAKIDSSWWRKEGHRLQIKDLCDIVKAKPEVVVIGTGYFGRMDVPRETRTYLESLGITVHAVRTSDAVTLFNRLQQDAAAIVAALHLTC
ncbi:MAG: MTH938/NDUFAF3 family protein [Gammaproteobacteria bacterium]|nr:MTH938/NDUFAF3 family protein [Gammaproteobacteria bacterium]MCI0590377.1 MTH938/NDUFAF3 family protein [Gammaproteobacteria bacterium]